MMQFVKNYDDLSNDRGFQFRFHCDKCGNGYKSSFQTSMTGTAGSLLRAAGNLFGGWFGSVGDSARENPKAVGDKEHDSALTAAVKEGKQYLHQCTRCRRWVCPKSCWNTEAGQCEGCAPKFEKQTTSGHNHATSDTTRQYLMESSMSIEYVSKLDMSAGSMAGSRRKGTSRFCPDCGASAGLGKFCPECGSLVPAAKALGCTCSQCGQHSQTVVKFCPECGGKCRVDCFVVRA